MKKMLSAALALAVALGLLAGCSGAPASSAASVSGAPAVSSSAAAGSAAPESTGTPAAERTAFRIASLKGPTTMGLVKLMDEADKGEARHDYEVTMYGAADEIAPQLIKGDIDVALVPCNLAGVLYNKTGGAVEVAAVNTLGVLYVVTTGDDITSVADLAGKTIYTTGKGTTPEYVLNYVLTQNGLTPGEDVTIEYMSEATEVLAAMQASSGYPVAMLPQPYVTTAQMQMEGLKVALDMTEEWDKVSPDSALVTGVVVARKEFVEQNEAAFNEFLEDYKASTEFVNANVDEAAALVAGYEIVPQEPIAQKALPYFRSACTVGLGLCWKSGVAAEVIGITSGSIGEALYNAKILFSTAELLAWTVVIVLLSLAFERLFLWGLARVESVLLERSGT